MVVLPLILFSCSGRKEKPKDLLPEKKMAAILTDQLLAESYAAQEAIYLGVTPAVLLDSILYPELFKRHEVDSAVYNRSLLYYENDPKRLRSLVDESIKILQKKDKVAVKSPPRKHTLPALPNRTDMDQMEEVIRKRLSGVDASP